MKANELRIGNFVLYQEYYIATVHGITDPDYGNGIHVHYDNVCIGCEHGLISGIPLTEEWLRKFGFEDNDYTFDLYIGHRKISFTWFSRVVSTGVRSGFRCQKYKHIKYVHQLQNLCFALTGNELTIKEEQQ